ncbi:MAG: hypothetical protein JKY52_07735 [Flavobacteriales bacterium]|nr:hypothetical protein [Flavobacteriales bacterium]
MVFKSIQYGITEIARELNPKIGGWLNYYGKYRISDLNPSYSQNRHSLVNQCSGPASFILFYAPCPHCYCGTIRKGYFNYSPY